MRRCLLLFPIALISAGILGAGIVGAQQPPAQPADAGQEPAVTFRTETNFVEVHAIVTDEDGAFVHDLTLDDFEIYEDGRLQEPSVFSFVDLPIERPFTPRNADAPTETSEAPTGASIPPGPYEAALEMAEELTARPLRGGGPARVL